MSWTTIAPLIGVLLAPLLTYIVAVRRSSGSIRHTEAATLWEEAEKMRAAYRQEVDALREEGAAMRNEMADLRTQAVLWRNETAELRLDAANCKGELAVMKSQLKALRGEK